MTRGDELNFASQNCDIFISTAPTSTFAFWMAYLMPEVINSIFAFKYKNSESSHILYT